MSVILRPIITEKTLALTTVHQYTFEVDRRANAIEIARAVERQFTVEVADVHVMNVSGKARRYRKAIGQTRQWKKAIVTLAKNGKIAGFELETDEKAAKEPTSQTTVTATKKSAKTAK